MADMSWQDKLKLYKTDTAAAQKEIERAKAVYEQKKRAGDMKGAEAAHRWAEQVRAASGIANNDSMYGNDPRTYKGSKGSDSSDVGPLSPPPVLQPPNLSGAGMGVTPDLMEAIFGMMGGGGLPDDQMRNIRDSAQRRAEMERQAFERQLQMLRAQQQAALGNIAFGQRQLQAQQMQNMRNFMLNMGTMNHQRGQEQAALEAMMKQYGINRSTGLEQIKNSTEDAKQALEHKGFQNYLQSRQEIANRGLSGSGIAADADTRLLLNQQNAMAGIMRDAATRQADLEAKYGANMDKAKADAALLQSKYGNNMMKLLSDMSASGMNLQNQAFKLIQDRGNIFSQFAPQMGSVHDKMSAINPALYEQEMMGQAQANADKATNQRLQILSTLLGKMLPYDSMTMNQMAQLGLNYDKLNSGNLNDYFNRLIGQSQHQDMMDYRYKQLEQNGLIDWSKLLGVTPDGSPTLDARKLQQQQAYQSQLLQLRQQGLINDQQYREAMLQLNAMKFDESRMQHDRQVLYQAMTRIDSEMSSLRAAIGNITDPAMKQQAQARLNELNRQKIYLMNQFTGTPDPNAPALGYGPQGYPVYGPPIPK